MNRCDILVPLKVEADSVEGLRFAADMAGDMSLDTTLLHVVELNIFPLDRRVYDELCLEYQQKLQKLAGCFPGDHLRLRVRIGKPHEEILAEARDCRADLIVLGAPKHRRRLWLFHSNTVERVVRDAPCRTLVMSETPTIAAAPYRHPEFLFGRGRQELVAN